MERENENSISRRNALKHIMFNISALSATSLIGSCAPKGVDSPNIILMVADNLGRESVGYYGNRIFNTPNIDKLASEGVIFENCHIATPICAPARCGWNTGRHPFRVGLNSQIDEAAIPDYEITIAEVLKNAGYHTALIGKWNLGYEKKSNPIYHGFEEYYGSNAGHADYYTHVYSHDLKKHFYRGLEPVDDQGYFDELFTNEAIAFLNRLNGNSKPFYLNLCFYAPHGPYQAPPGYYHGTPDENYRYMIEYLDKCVGRVVDEVDNSGLKNNTLIVFLSDQGGSYINNYGRTLRQNSLKVVCNARWPGIIPQGKRVKTPWVHLDIYTTLIELGGGNIPTDRVVDGQNIWPLFLGNELSSNRTLYWTYRHWDAIQEKGFKLHMTKGTVDGLYNLTSDPDEQKDLSKMYPDLVKKLKARQEKWKSECRNK